MREVLCWGLGLPSHPCSPLSSLHSPSDSGRCPLIQAANVADTQPMAPLNSGLWEGGVGRAVCDDAGPGKTNPRPQTCIDPRLKASFPLATTSFPVQGTPSPVCSAKRMASFWGSQALPLGKNNSYLLSSLFQRDSSACHREAENHENHQGI